MAKIDELFIKEVVNQEKKSIYSDAILDNINNNEFKRVLIRLEKLSEMYYTKKKFDDELIVELGIINCSNAFKQITKKYVEYKKDNVYDLNSVKIDKIINNNYQKLRKTTFKNNSENMIYNIAVIKTFSNIYFQIKDLNKGKDYKDKNFIETKRKISKKQSFNSNLVKAKELGSNVDLSINDIENIVNNNLDNGIDNINSLFVKDKKYVYKK